MNTTNKPKTDATEAKHAASGDSSSSDLLARWVHPQNIETCKKAFDNGEATLEIIHMAAALLALSEDTTDSADDEAADGFLLTAETTRARADAYRQSYDALLKIWG